MLRYLFGLTLRGIPDAAHMPKSDASFDPATYATVADRLQLFYAKCPTGRIITELVGRERGVITFRASLYRSAGDTVPAATGWASEREGDGDINTVACLENTETSAIGRALANLGFTASINRPSREEMDKAHRARLRLERPTSPPQVTEPPRPTRARDDEPDVQHKADATLDLFDLLATARRHGFSATRARIIIAGANGVIPLPSARLRRIESALRSWIRRHFTVA